MSLLDRPIWSSLSGSQQHLSEGDALARRYQPDVNLFAAPRDQSPEALARLTGLLAPGDQAYLAEAGPVTIHRV